MILNQLRHAMDVFLFDKPDACYDEIKSRFGAPQQIAASYVEGKEPEELLKKLIIKKRVLVGRSNKTVYSFSGRRRDLGHAAFPFIMS